MASDNLFNNAKPSVFFGLLLKSTTVAKISSLATKSGNERTVLTNFYNLSDPLIMDIIYMYQGWKGQKINIEVPAAEYINAEYLMKDLLDNCSKYKQLFKDCQAILDGITKIEGIGYSTLYSLTLD